MEMLIKAKLNSITLVWSLVSKGTLAWILLLERGFQASGNMAHCIITCTWISLDFQFQVIVWNYLWCWGSKLTFPCKEQS